MSWTSLLVIWHPMVTTHVRNNGLRASMDASQCVLSTKNIGNTWPLQSLTHKWMPVPPIWTYEGQLLLNQHLAFTIPQCSVCASTQPVCYHKLWCHDCGKQSCMLSILKLALCIIIGASDHAQTHWNKIMTSCNFWGGRQDTHRNWGWFVPA